jgi:hypothetical protein
LALGGFSVCPHLLRWDMRCRDELESLHKHLTCCCACACILS